MHSTLRFITNASKSANHLHISASSRIQISAALHEVNLMPSRHQNFTKVIGNKKQTHFLTVSFSIFRNSNSIFLFLYAISSFECKFSYAFIHHQREGGAKCANGRDVETTSILVVLTGQFSQYLANFPNQASAACRVLHRLTYLYVCGH